MAAETSKIQSKLSSLSSSLDELESLLQPVFSQTLAETVVVLEPLQQAKLQTVLPYAVYDLVFMYLKLEGVDPKTHPVIGELGRIKEYFDKISDTENPPQRRIEIDQAAAGRFIKNAITQLKWRKTAAEEEEPATSSSSPKEKVPVKVTSKMLERQQYEEELRKADAEGGDEEEETLEVFDDDNAMHVDEAKASEEQSGSRRKRQRPVLDPFEGVADDAESPKPSAAPSTEAATQSTPAESSDAPKKKKKKTSSNASSGKKKKAK